MPGFLLADQLEHGYKFFLVRFAGQFVIQLQGLLFTLRQPTTILAISNKMT